MNTTNVMTTKTIKADHGSLTRGGLPAAAWAALLLLLLPFAAARRAVAQTVGTTTPAPSIATTYSTQKREFHVGILLLDSTIIDDRSTADVEYPKGPENSDPYVFYIADALTELKPQGWEFINPLAPATVTSAIKSRWDARMSGNSNYTVGQKVSKDMACYWEVYLSSTPLNDLLKFDLLFITNHRKTAFTPADREKLRKLVDAGGIVWMEDCGNLRIGTKNGDGSYQNDRFFLDQVQFTSGNDAGLNNGQAGAPAIYQPTHPILNTPYALTYDDVANLGDKNYADFAMAKLDPTTNKPVAGMPNPETLVNIVGNKAVGPAGGPYQPYIAAGYYGSGAVILTSGDSGCDINDYAGGTNSGSGGNSGPFCGPNIRTAHPMDLKFLYNCVAWGGSTSAFRRNDRRTASTFEDVGAPLLSNFDFTGQLFQQNDVMNSQTAPLFINNLLFSTGVANGVMTLRAYDPHPGRDYDGDGNTDDGRLDNSLGYSYDQVWEAATGGSAGLGGSAVAGPTSGTYEQPSPPIYGEVHMGGNAQTGMIFVALPDGTVNAYTAFPVDAIGRLQPTSTAIWSMAPTQGGSATYDYNATHGVTPAPVFYENKIFQIQPNGMVRCLSAVDGSLLYQSFAASAPPGGVTIIPSGTPTLGLNRLTTDVTQTSSSSPAQNQNAGMPSTTTPLANNSLGSTNDVMLYCPTIMTQNGNTFGQILAYWLGTRNEVQKGIPGGQTGSDVYMNTRISGGTGSPGQYWFGMAAGSNPASNSPYTFLQPRVRVFSPIRADGSDPNITAGTETSTALDEYLAGVESTNYTATWEQTGGQYTGRVLLTRLAGAAAWARPPGPRNWTNSDATGQEADILISVDYDVTLISPSTGTPQNYGSTGPNGVGIGARTNPLLRMNSYDYNDSLIPYQTLDTMSFSALDTLVYGELSKEQNTTSATNAPEYLLSIYGLHEEEGNSRVRWRFTLPHPLSDGTSQAAGTTTNLATNVLVNDDYPIYNSVNFDPNWPAVDVADKPGTVNFATTGTLTSAPVYVTRTIGSPIVSSNGLTYVLAEGVAPQSYATGGAPVSVLMAFKSEPNITLTLPVPFNPSVGVTVAQIDAGSTSAGGSTATTIRASASTTGANSSSGNYLRLDGPHGRIEIINAAVQPPNQVFSASQSFVVSAQPVGEATPRTFIISPKPDSTFGNQATLATNTDPSTQQIVIGGGFTPLQWYYVVLGDPQSAPTLIGNYLFFTVKNTTGTAGIAGESFLMALDTDPTATDPNVRTGFGDQATNVYAKQIDPSPSGSLTPTDQTIDHTKMGRALSASTTALFTAPPVASGGVMALNSSLGTFGLTDETTLVADARRIIEVGADAGAQWALHGTQQRSVVGGVLPVFSPTGTLLNAPANGVTTMDTRTISHPQSARHIGNGDYLIADTGNNRVIRTDRSGVITWTLDTLTDPFQILGGGESTTLNQPTDVQYYLTPTVNSGGTQAGYEVHYLVADAGNSRIVEVADYFDANGNATDAPGTGASTTFGSTSGKHVVVWATRTQSTQGHQYRFESISRYLGTDPTGTYYGYPYIIATVSNARVAGGNSTATSDFGGGSLLSLNYAPYQTALQVVNTSNSNPTTITPWPAPATVTPVTVAANEPTGNGTVLAAADDLEMRDASGNLVIRRLSRPTYFEQITLPGKTITSPTGPSNPPRTVYLVCDTDGVYAVYATADATGKPVRQVIWMFRQQEYDAINGYDDVNGVVLAGGRVAQPPTSQNASGANVNGDPTELPRFRPSSVELLPNGHFLITNSWTGKSALFQSGRFVGEVFEVDPQMNLIQRVTLVDNTPSTPTLYYPGGTGAGVYNNVYAGFSAPRLFLGSIPASGLAILNDQIMGNPGNTNLLEQPLFGDRQ